MIIARTVIVIDPLARANVVAALAGPGGPSGITSCSAEGETITVGFDSDRTSAELIDALIEVESTFVPARFTGPLSPADAAIGASRGLNDPQIDAFRLIETYLP